MHTQITLKVSDTSQVPITSPFEKDAPPVVHAPRKYPITMQPLVHEKLDEWEKSDIITPVEEPTDWVSSLAYSMKTQWETMTLLESQEPE